MRTRLFHALVGVAAVVGCSDPDSTAVVVTPADSAPAASDTTPLADSSADTSSTDVPEDAVTDAAADAATDAPTDADAEAGWPPTK